MKDLRSTLNVNKNNNESNFSFRPFKWLRRNVKNIITIMILFVAFNILFNPGGVSRFVSTWLSEFTTNWNIK